MCTGEQREPCASLGMVIIAGRNPAIVMAIISNAIPTKNEAKERFQVKI